MNKYIPGLVGAVLVGLAAFGGTALASYVQGGTSVASVLGSTGKEEKVMKVTDGAVTCYVVTEQFPAISCVK